jgi:D-Tyr-tRNAtyr deacylase
LQVVENDFELLLVSQFTLFGKLKGNKLEFVKVSTLCD